MLCPSSCAADSTPLLFYLPYLPHRFNFHPTDATFACNPRREKQATSEETQTRQSVHACSRARLVLPKLAVKPPKYPPTPRCLHSSGTNTNPNQGHLQGCSSQQFLPVSSLASPATAHLTLSPTRGLMTAFHRTAAQEGFQILPPPFPHPLSVAVRASGVTSVRLIGCCLHQLDEQKRR